MGGSSSPVDREGREICWNFNAHLGRTTQECERAHFLYKDRNNLSCVMQIVLANRAVSKDTRGPPIKKFRTRYAILGISLMQNNDGN